MIRNQFILDLHPEMIVDNFAGGGGASTGIELALGRSVDIAINHDAEALAMHAMNHPQTRHYCEDVFAVDPVEVTGGRPVGFAWFSPDCKHFSKAKGGKPREKKIRGLAWVMVKWADSPVAPRVMILENVEEFQDWGPLLPDGTPCKRRKGWTFKSFKKRLAQLGYQVEHRELRACDYGAPTIRKRFFLIARRDGKPIVWPAATHGKPTSPGVLSGALKPWRTAAECIDWSIPCPSIFERKRPLAEATLWRIARGIRKFVIESPNPFIVKVNHSGAGFRGQAVDEPLQTITAKHGYGIAVLHVTKFRGGATGTACDEPLHTVTAGPKENPAGAAHAMGLVNATLAPFVTEHANASNQRNMRADEPMRTLCAQVKGGHFAIVALTLVGAGGPIYGGKPKSVDEPIGTLVAENHKALVAATLVQTGYGEREGQAPRAPGLDKPLGTVVAGAAKHALVGAFLAKHYGGVTGSDIADPVHTVTSVDHNALVSAQIVGCGGRAGQSRPRDVSEPLQTLTAKADSCVISSHLSKLYGTTTGQALDEPVHTVTGQGNHFAEVRAFLIKYYGNEQDGHGLREPLGTVTTRDRFGIIIIHGEEYVITDIGMRMLEPHELYKAQGFPADYIIAFERNGRPLPKHAQVRMCGNSVPPPFAKALALANVPELAVRFADEIRPTDRNGTTSIIEVVDGRAKP